MFGAYIGNGKMLISSTWGGKLVAPSNDYSLMPDLTIHGIFDPSLTKYLINTLKAGNKVIDAGANIGYFTVLASYLVGSTGKVISYEANPSTFNLLMENITLNLCQNTTAFNKAVYSHNDLLSFYVSERFSGNSSLYEPDDAYIKYFISDKVSKKIEIEAEPLNELLETLGHIDLIKIDVEGAEYQTFLGMDRLIMNSSVSQVVFELNRLRMKNDWEDMKMLLNKFQFLYGAEYYIILHDGTLQSIHVDKMFSADYIENVVIKFN
ncbi:FkbM family methyltransferase [Paenibacillus shunpengii]|uniref:FkbM family methyltransferase n=1 Tax=Paenibacillus shunpengii TaxID=2054424 RepID=A0ABW5SU76_9BACL